LFLGLPFDPGDEDSKGLWNIGGLLPAYTALNPLMSVKLLIIQTISEGRRKT
jgi:hypothetical protein